MSSGARLRSANAAFGRSKTGTAFLISAKPPEGPIFQCTWRTGFGGQGPLVYDFPPMPVAQADCGCTTIPSPDFPNRLSFGSFGYVGPTKGLGWEDPPHPAIQVAAIPGGSGYTKFIPEHCAKQCPGWPSLEFGNYGFIEGENVIDEASTIEGSVPATSGVIHISFRTVDGPPWDPFGEDIDFTILYTAATLPDPGPYNIVAARPHRFQAGWTTLTFDREVRYATGAALFIAGTGIYDGMQAARPTGEDFQDAPEDLAIETAFVSTVAVGTAIRVWDSSWDCWNNSVTPPGPRPPLPPAPS